MCIRDRDLSYVPKDKMVILCVHIPFRNSNYAYYDEVLELLSQYKYATIMSVPLELPFGP